MHQCFCDGLVGGVIVKRPTVNYLVAVQVILFTVAQLAATQWHLHSRSAAAPRVPCLTLVTSWASRRSGIQTLRDVKPCGLLSCMRTIAFANTCTSTSASKLCMFTQASDCLTFLVSAADSALGGPGGQGHSLVVSSRRTAGLGADTRADARHHPDATESRHAGGAYAAGDRPGPRCMCVGRKTTLMAI